MVVVPVRVKVNVPVSVPGSEAVASEAVSVIAGSSSSTMARTAVPGLPTLQAGLPTREATTVSAPSTKVSLTGVMVMDAVAFAAGMMTVDVIYG